MAKYAARAARRWLEGDKVLAHIELAFARLPPLENEDDAFRLFLAETLLTEGMTPRNLTLRLGFDPGLLKYAPDQPRVPAGSGRDSGRWTFGSGISNPQNRIKASQLRFIALRVAANELRPGGTAVIPLAERNPLDPWTLNKDPPSPQEQKDIADALNIILGGTEKEIEKLQPHSFQNLPHSTTGAILPPAVGGYRSYSTSPSVLGRGANRLVIDQATHDVYYTNNHYFSFYHVRIVPNDR